MDLDLYKQFIVCITIITYPIITDIFIHGFNHIYIFTALFKGWACLFVSDFKITVCIIANSFCLHVSCCHNIYIFTTILFGQNHQFFNKILQKREQFAFGPFHIINILLPLL